MECYVLGQVEVIIDGAPVDLGGPRQQLIVAGLLFHAGRVVTVPDLVQLVWDEDPPATARNQLQNAVYRLRRLLGIAGAALRTDPAGYRLTLAEDRLDLTRFQVTLQRARAATDHETAATLYRAALDEWRDTPFAGLLGATVARWRDSLVEQRWAATEEWAEIMLDLRRHREVVERLAPLVAGHPMRERLAGALMAALHREGRQAESLQLYHRTVVALREELGVDPGPHLRDLHLEVLRGTGQVTAAPETATASALPRVAPLRGRVEETHRLLWAARGAHRVIVVDGMAGVGKSAFAVSAAEALREDYPGAQLFVDLQGHSEGAPVAPVDALGLLLAQLNEAPQRIPDDLPGRQVLWRRALTGRRAVVVLDNVAGAEQVRPLLPPANAVCVVLVTSRTRIGPVDGAFLLSLEPLPVGAAVSVLRDAIGDRVDAEPDAAAEVVELCGRLPLAVRLIAHRLQHRPKWSVSAMAERLRAADPPPIAVSAEGHSVAAAFDVSYRQLSELEQRCFRLLGLHPAGEFEVWPAAALVETAAPQARELLDRLVEVHLLQEDQPGHYRLHDLLREFAGTLVTVAERPAAMARLLDYYLRTAAVVNSHMELRPQDAPSLPPDAFTRPFAGAQENLAWMRSAWPALVALADEAHGGGAHWHAVMLHRILWRFANIESRSEVTDRLGRQAIASARVLGDDGLIAQAYKWHAGTMLRLCRPADSIEYLREAATYYAAAGMPGQLGAVEVNLGVVCRVTGRLEESLAHHRTGHRLCREAGDVSSLLRGIADRGSALLRLGRPEQARVALREAVIGMHQQSATASAEAWAASEFGRVHLALGHPRLALLLLRRALRINTEANNPAGAAETLGSIGRAHAALGDLDEALRCQLDACEQVRHLPDPHFEPLVRNDLGATLTLLGRTDEAIAVYERVLLLAAQTGQRYEQARAHAGRADALRRAGRDDTGERAAARALFRWCGLSEEAAARASEPPQQPVLLDDRH
ncbi:BTAD domain-containing putative transcriptional regulator [Dactylosporangium siamense]|uniref:SARP family transcriptional regulator n=1 Tax=Dactylosporangium siamense TaxID=685454 RepID=A0A919Q1W2_9ACTN|nr:BTAD domain-containing putative transcriptional regulator [Dactylosporangium siamense]GIG52728.1 SARP family transcriptional regulator [Dactylosporangium siamense]